jgi:crotonobetainyl-CoA:carnitine CoA-transferase CaiB-like acyl-CoA transferase
LAGAEVIKIEGTQRPDGARQGPPPFFDLLNQGKCSVALDLHTSKGQQQLLELIHDADIVIEGSRPRALRQMGVVAEELIREISGLSWLSISGYGRQEPQANWIAYGDDAGVAAGLSAIMYEATGKWVICGDAIADPLTGLHAALAGWASWMAGGGHLIDISLCQTVRHCLSATDTIADNIQDRQKRWVHYLLENQIAISSPVGRAAATSAVPMGANTRSVLDCRVSRVSP